MTTAKLISAEDYSALAVATADHRIPYGKSDQFGAERFIIGDKAVLDFRIATGDGPKLSGCCCSPSPCWQAPTIGTTGPIRSNSHLLGIATSPSSAWRCGSTRE